MPKFFFKAKDWSGKLVKGTLELSDKGDVIESIRGSGLVPLSIEEEKGSFVRELMKLVAGRMGGKEVTTFTRQLATMMTAGLPLTDALSLLKTQSQNKPMVFEVMESALATVRGGQSLARALEKYQRFFGEAYIASVGAGEEGGVLEEVLTKLADNMEKENEFKGKVKGAMIYPIIVVIGMIAVMIVMMVFVIPKLLSLYADFGTAKLPTATRILMSISSIMTRFWFAIPIVVGGLVVFFQVSAKVENLRYKKDKMLLKIPIWGELLQKTITANLSRTLSMLLAAGISLVEALKIVSKVTGNEVYARAIIKVSERVQKGFSIASSFADTGVFPMILNQMVETGEATGKLDEVLMKVSNYFSTEAEQSVRSLTAAIEPLIMVVLGIGVGFLVVAVIMPIYNLTSSF